MTAVTAANGRTMLSRKIPQLATAAKEWRSNMQITGEIFVPPPAGAILPGIDFGGAPGSNFQPQHILYYRLKILRNNSQDPSSWTYQFPIYGLYDGLNITQFIEMVRADDLPGLGSTSDDPLEPASITVTDQCYAVMELTSDDSTMRFLADQPAIKTVEDHKSQYRRLSHVDTDGNIRLAKAPAATAECRLIYFAVRSVNPGEDDDYYMYVQFDGMDQGQPKVLSAKLKVIDPAIKNRGGTDDLTVAMAQSRLDKAVAGRSANRRAQKQRAKERARAVPATGTGTGK